MSKTSKIVGIVAVSNVYISKFLGQNVSIKILFLDSNGNTDWRRPIPKKLILKKTISNKIKISKTILK